MTDTKNLIENYEIGRHIKIPPKEIFHLWEKTKRTHFIGIRCPYCYEITSIRIKTEKNKLQLKCSCEIPPNPTPKTITIFIYK